ncbi:MAG: hypothetical protein MR908_05375 [Firmicutes bacterium]|nr:hypothetical protein [Bacillota bacterium]
MKRQYFEVCKNCGAHLDPGERCDCEQARTPMASLAHNFHPIGQTGTLHMQTIGGGLAPYTTIDGGNRHRA